jgi:hypothetical protein
MMADNAARQRAYRQRQRDKGLVQVSIWVPRDYAKSVKSSATTRRTLERLIRTCENGEWDMK